MIGLSAFQSKEEEQEEVREGNEFNSWLVKMRSVNVSERETAYDAVLKRGKEYLQKIARIEESKKAQNKNNADESKSASSPQS